MVWWVVAVVMYSPPDVLTHSTVCFSEELFVDWDVTQVAFEHLEVASIQVPFQISSVGWVFAQSVKSWYSL